jgi:hypothetical protein
MSRLQDVLAWLLAADLGRDKLALLLLCSLSTYAVATNLIYRLRLKSWLGRWLVQFFRLAYYVGIPCAVLWRGGLVSQMGIPTTFAAQEVSVLAMRLLGLGQARDMLLVVRGLMLGAGALCLLVVVWIWYARTVSGELDPDVRVSWWIALREAVFMQLFWAFYRGFVATLTSDRTVIAFGGLALVAFAWLWSPRRRQDLFTPRGYLVVQDWMCALFTAFMSLTVQALWLLIVVHVLWLWVGGRVLSRFGALHLGGSLADQVR